MQPLRDLLNALADLHGDWHAAGCLEMPNLAAMAKHASARRIRRSVETGAGKSTLLLSHLSDHHVVFAVNDGNSLDRARQSELLRKETTEFVEGPTQLTLMNHQFTEPIQLAFIDGPHGFPFPNMEYWKLYPHLEAGGLLIIDDIHIPTIRQMFEFLREDPMFTLLETVGKTAFFERTSAPTFSPVQDGWWLQDYNTRRFPVQYDNVGLGVGEAEPDPSVYRERLLPLIAHWQREDSKVAIFGIGGHTETLFRNVPELANVRLIAYLDTSMAHGGVTHRGLPVHSPSWAAGRVDVVLCSSFAHELAQLEILDTIAVKAVLSHPPVRKRVAQTDVPQAA
jgi:Methyltransferase domain